MFASVGWTYNITAGCEHGCAYCYAAMLNRKWKRSFKPNFREHFLKVKLPDDGTWIFMGSMGDIMSPGIKPEWFHRILDRIEHDGHSNKFLLQTKNPTKLFRFIKRLEKLKDRVIIGTTLETTGITPWSQAPETSERAQAMIRFKQLGFKAFLSLEPLAELDLEQMSSWIEEINPEAVELGVENYTDYLTKPSKGTVIALLKFLDEKGIPYQLKASMKKYLGKEGLN